MNKTYSNPIFKDLEKKALNDLGRVENKITDYLGVNTYFINPSYYYSESIIKDERISFVVETITETLTGRKCKPHNVIIPINEYKGHKYWNSYKPLLPLSFGEEKRNCVNCLRYRPFRRDEKKEYADRLACVSCSLNPNRDFEKRIKKCAFLG